MPQASSALHCNDKPRLSPLQRALLDIVIGAQRGGTKDLTAKEIQCIHEQRVSHRVGDGAVAGRVSELVSLGYLQRAPEKRRSVFPGAGEDVSSPVFAPSQQARLLS